MLRSALGFFVLGLIFMIFGVSGVTVLSLEAGRDLLFLFLVLSALSAVAGLAGGRKPRGLL